MQRVPTVLSAAGLLLASTAVIGAGIGEPMLPIDSLVPASFELPPDMPLWLSEEMQPPELLEWTKPEWLGHGPAGESRLVLAVEVTTSGAVGRVVLVKPLPGPNGKSIEDECARAVKEWRYRPALRKGKPVAVTFVLVFDFKLEER